MKRKPRDRKVKGSRRWKRRENILRRLQEYESYRSKGVDRDATE